MNFRRIAIEPVSGNLGVIIKGVDLAKLDDETFAEIHQAWLKYSVIFFRKQKLRPFQQIDFAKRFGEIHFHPYMRGLDDHPEILEIIKEPGENIHSEPSGILIKCSTRNQQKQQCFMLMKFLQVAETRNFQINT